MSGPARDLERRARALALRLEGRTFEEIGRALRVTRQGAQFLVRPDRATVDHVKKRARNRCESCAVRLPKAGHIHHLAARGLTPVAYNAALNLMFVCRPCHRRIHKGDPATRAEMKATVDRLVVAERESGLTHRAFAESIGLSESYWCHIRRRKQISIKALSTVVQSRPDLVLTVMNEMTEAVA